MRLQELPAGTVTRVILRARDRVHLRADTTASCTPDVVRPGRAMSAVSRSDTPPAASKVRLGPLGDVATGSASDPELGVSPATSQARPKG
ncbi:hypothetical protein GCM10025867_11670 [Frondihabitans sucicola]|uniref:Ferrous iron transport protein A n=1 Tax=Frondihabitans sucicola TaxID=1268041 RepID=A0ABM8GKK6_9MICO|nr:hypothetical protein GCM10025867_11670 [Frondihabitans sucicola]